MKFPFSRIYRYFLNTLNTFSKRKTCMENADKNDIKRIHESSFTATILKKYQYTM